jgi:pre-mRNA-splicing helicase BRR2
LERFKKANLDSVYDIMELEDDQRTELLQMNDRQLARVAKFVNSTRTLRLRSRSRTDSLDSADTRHCRGHARP